MVSNLLKVTDLLIGGPALNLGSFRAKDDWFFIIFFAKLMGLEGES